ncbi:MAG: MaoC family dehydratase [Deltaproteobacteria bacterium]
MTVDAGTVAFFQASFLDATPTYASARYARALGFRDRPVHPLLLLNLGLSFSVHDVSEQAIAHLAYIDARFPEPCYPGDSVRAWSTVLGAKKASDGNRGVAHVRTVLRNERDEVVCQFERKVLVKAGGQLTDRPTAPPSVLVAPDATRVCPAVFDHRIDPRPLGVGFAGYYEDFAAGDVICHDVGRTVSESEHMQLTYLFRNTHPLHFEEPYAKTGFAKTRVVYGGLVFGWIASLASRDTTGNVVWDLGFDKGAHPAGVVAGDTLYAASKVLDCVSANDDFGRVTFRLVGTKNSRPATLLDGGADLFTDELSKGTDQKIPHKVFEITRTVLMRKRPR